MGNGTFWVSNTSNSIQRSSFSSSSSINESIPHNVTQRWFCCSCDAQRERTGPWQDTDKLISMFLAPLLENPPPEEPLDAADPGPSTFLVEIHTYSESGILESSRYITLKADRKPIRHNFEYYGHQNGFMTRYRPRDLSRDFNELRARDSFRCRIHRCDFQVSVYCKAKDQDIFCCPSCLVCPWPNRIPLPLHDRDMIFWRNWVSSLESGELLVNQNCSPDSIFKVSTIPLNPEDPPSIRVFRFDEAIGMHEIGAIALPLPQSLQSLRLIGAEAHIMKIFCEEHRMRYRIDLYLRGSLRPYGKKSIERDRLAEWLQDVRDLSLDSIWGEWNKMDREQDWAVKHPWLGLGRVIPGAIGGHLHRGPEKRKKADREPEWADKHRRMRLGRGVPGELVREYVEERRGVWLTPSELARMALQ